MSRFASLLAAWLLLLILLPASLRAADGGPNWSMKVVTFGKTRQSIKSKPIHLRPNRPLHFYGNSQRRAYYRNKQQAATPSRPAPTGLPGPRTASQSRRRR